MAADMPFSQQKYGVPEGLQRVNCHFNPKQVLPQHALFEAQACVLQSCLSYTFSGQ